MAWGGAGPQAPLIGVSRQAARWRQPAAMTLAEEPAGDASRHEPLPPAPPHDSLVDAADPADPRVRNVLVPLSKIRFCPTYKKATLLLALVPFNCSSLPPLWKRTHFRAPTHGHARTHAQGAAPRPSARPRARPPPPPALLRAPRHAAYGATAHTCSSAVSPPPPAMPRQPTYRGSVCYRLLQTPPPPPTHTPANHAFSTPARPNSSLGGAATKRAPKHH